MNTKQHFRLLLNHRIDLGTEAEKPIQPKVRFVEKTVPHIHKQKAIIAVFDIGPESEIHFVELLSEHPELPYDYDELTSEMQAAIRDDATTVALKNRNRNRKVRDNLAHYAAQGVIELCDANGVPQNQTNTKKKASAI